MSAKIRYYRSEKNMCGMGVSHGQPGNVSETGKMTEVRQSIGREDWNDLERFKCAGGQVVAVGQARRQKLWTVWVSELQVELAPVP